jgi:hypothetical protein
MLEYCINNVRELRYINNKTRLYVNVANFAVNIETRNVFGQDV